MSETLRLFTETAQTRDPVVVREMFGRVAPRYDRANHLLSVGCDFWWRHRAARLVRNWNARCLLDLATGSGDLALTLQRRLPNIEVIGADFSPEMLALAREKGVRKLVLADALALPFADQSFDGLTVAFGLRNMQDWAKALHEIRRVLTRNGELLILDFSLPQFPPWRILYRVYLHHVLPRFCRILTREQDAYRYLGASIENFPSGDAMCRLINGNGFVGARARPLTGGIVTCYTASAGTEPSS